MTLIWLVSPSQGHDLPDLVKSNVLVSPSVAAGENMVMAKTSAYSDFYQSVTT